MPTAPTYTIKGEACKDNECFAFEGKFTTAAELRSYLVQIYKKLTGVKPQVLGEWRPKGKGVHE